MVLTLKGSDDENGCPLSGSDIRSHLTVGFAQSRSPTATKFGPSRTIILPKKQELVGLLYRGKQSVPPRGSRWLRSPNSILKRLRTYPLPRSGTDCFPL